MQVYIGGKKKERQGGGAPRVLQKATALLKGKKRLGESRWTNHSEPGWGVLKLFN